jgi:Leucine-rich repeat (LRR) protein
LKELLSRVAENTSVTSLDLSQNALGDERLALVADSLRRNKCLRRLDVASNGLGQSAMASRTVESFVTLMRRHLALTDLRLWDETLESVPAALAKSSLAKMRYFMQANVDIASVASGDGAELMLKARGISRDLTLCATRYGHLTAVDLSHNILDRLPRCLFALPNLQHLVAHHNMIRELDDDVGSLRALRSLDLAHNRLHELPAAPIARLVHLEVLDVAHNDLLSVPVAALASLPRLARLGVAGNSMIDNVPFEVLDTLDVDDWTTVLDYVRANANPDNVAAASSASSAAADASSRNSPMLNIRNTLKLRTHKRRAQNVSMVVSGSNSSNGHIAASSPDAAKNGSTASTPAKSPRAPSQRSPRVPSQPPAKHRDIALKRSPRDKNDDRDKNKESEDRAQREQEASACAAVSSPSSANDDVDGADVPRQRKRSSTEWVHTKPRAAAASSDGPNMLAESAPCPPTTRSSGKWVFGVARQASQKRLGE